MIINVKLTYTNKIRNVNIPDELWENKTLKEKLEAVFYYGQNDFQPLWGFCLVSIGI